MRVQSRSIKDGPRLSRCLEESGCGLLRGGDALEPARVHLRGERHAARREPFDKSTLGDVEAALLDANLGMTPNNDGEIIRLNIPQLTEDRRKDVAKEAKAVGEEAKVAVRGEGQRLGEEEGPCETPRKKANR